MAATTATERQLVSQIELARDLNLTDRRIRQLVTERILPPARDEGFDLELCRQRYGLYSSGSERDWALAFDAAEDLARNASDLNDRAFADGAAPADVTAASTAIQASTSMMNFLTASRSKSEAERALFWGLWDREERQALGALLARGMQLLGETHIRMDDGELVEVIPMAKAATVSKEAGRAKVSRRK
jgi:hypothetical protein